LSLINSSYEPKGENLIYQIMKDLLGPQDLLHQNEMVHTLVSSLLFLEDPCLHREDWQVWRDRVMALKKKLKGFVDTEGDMRRAREVRELCTLNFYVPS
jgi:hypothetical protein